MTRIRLADVARAAGVSPSTASLALNGAEARLAEGTRELVLRTAAEIGYRPNSVARALRTRRTRTVGMVLDQIATTPFAGLMVKGAQDAALARGSMLLLVDADADRQVEREAISTLVDRQVDALVLACMWHREITVPELPVRTVLLNCRARGDARPAVVPDERQGARLATTALLEAGHRRIAYIDAQADLVASPLRREAFLATMRGAGARVDPAWVRSAPIGPAGGDVLADLLSLPSTARPTAVFCFNDRIASGVLALARRRGLSVPRDLSVVGFDDQPFLASDLDPGLTTVALPHDAMGRWAIGRALDDRDGPRAREGEDPVHLMPCRLVTRSTIGPPGHDP